MNDLVNFGSNTSPSLSIGGFVTELLSSIPSALARPILDYQRMKTQESLMKLALEAKKAERIEILKTMRVLAEKGQLTPEISQALLSAYYQPPAFSPY